MPKVLYITSSSYSGSTLLSFLLNAHPDIFTVGEMNGWNYGEDETFTCSCGKMLSECPFFLVIAEAFRRNGLSFDFRNFGTDYRLARNERVNRYLTAQLPAAIPSTFLENLRDMVVGHIPPFSKLISQEHRANRTFFDAALSYSRSSVFVDACKDPYRLRHLHRIPGLDPYVVYLMRDVRGVVLSNLELKHPGLNAALATRMWIRQQTTILRILREFRNVLHVHYEDLCDVTDDSLGTIHRFAGVEPRPFGGDLKRAEHHILGNVMRLTKLDKIAKNTRWERELSPSDLESISSTAMDFVRRNRRHALSKIIRRYLG